MKIVWTKTSELTLDEIIDYIQYKFGKSISEKYYFDVLETVDAIEINPELFPVFQNKLSIRKAIINKKTILYYQIQKENHCCPIKI
jgi:plasmid stabilization system protein ParE